MSNEQMLQDMQQQLTRIERMTLIGAKEILDLSEAALFTGFSEGHLYRLTSGRLIPHYKKSNRLVFKKAELEEWMLSERIPTDAELQTQADTYCATHKRNV